MVKVLLLVTERSQIRILDNTLIPINLGKVVRDWLPSGYEVYITKMCVILN